jgi:DNA mismatch repair protein MutS
MIVDQTTLHDLSIFHAEEDLSVFNSLNYTRTVDGRRWLKHILSHPHSNINQILDTQKTLQQIIAHHHEWPTIITNGTMMVLERFYETVIDTIPKRPSLLEAWQYKTLHSADYSMTVYTVGHAIDFFQGINQLIQLFKNDEKSSILSSILDKMELLLQKPETKLMLEITDKATVSKVNKLKYGHFILYRYKSEIHELTELFSKLDAYYSLATAVKERHLNFPTFTSDATPHIEAENLYHILLKTPIPYQLQMDPSSNFIFLTGANMAGKSTFIKSVGVAVYLAHLGVGVPAKSMQLSLFSGLLSNINVVDNITKGESYFFNEVQRIKNTILKINNGQKWLVLIDELFKGTNVQDAMRCSTEVIKGLLKIKNSLFILSTHLYEIGEDLKPHANIAFRYFETEVTDEQLSFSYQLKEGISNDRLGYLILKREGVVEMIANL